MVELKQTLSSPFIINRNKTFQQIVFYLFILMMMFDWLKTNLMQNILNNKL